MYVLEVEEKNNTTFANEPGLIFSLALFFFYSLSCIHQLTYLTEENWSTMVAGYRAQCEGQGLGIVSFYEKKEEAAYEKDEL
jgi:hypothetical protein